jgi:3-phenylpropionate/cinnamic acid dioxygenase small subunit
MSENGKNVSPGDSRYSEILEFLHQEAELLDTGRFSDWLALMTEDIRYNMPVRTNRARSRPDHTEKTEIFSENMASLQMRVKRLSTDFAWAEIPPSRTRHLVTNVRVRATDNPDELEVLSYILVYRNRANSSSADILSGERKDVMRKVEGSWHLASRTILLDQVVVGSRNLSIFF